MILNLGKRTATPVGLSRDSNVTYDVTYSSPAKLQRTEGPQKVRNMFYFFSFICYFVAKIGLTNCEKEF